MSEVDEVKKREQSKLRMARMRERRKAQAVPAPIVMPKDPGAAQRMRRLRQSKLAPNKRKLELCHLPKGYEFGSYRKGDVGMERLYTRIYNGAYYKNALSMRRLATDYKLHHDTVKAVIQQLLKSGHIVDTGKVMPIHEYNVTLPIYALGLGEWYTLRDVEYIANEIDDVISMIKVVGTNGAVPDISTLWQYKASGLYGELSDYLRGVHYYREAYTDAVIADHLTIDQTELDAYLAAPGDGDKSIAVVDYDTNKKLRTTMTRTGWRWYNQVTQMYGGKNGHAPEREMLLRLDGEKVASVDMTSAHPRLLLHAIGYSLEYLGLMYNRSEASEAVAHAAGARALLQAVQGDVYNWTASVLGCTRQEAKGKWAGLLNMNRWMIANKRFSFKPKGEDRVDFKDLYFYLTNNHPGVMAGIQHAQQTALNIRVNPGRRGKQQYSSIYELLEVLENHVMTGTLNKHLIGVRVHDELIVPQSMEQVVRTTMESFLLPDYSVTDITIRKAIEHEEPMKAFDAVTGVAGIIGRSEFEHMECWTVKKPMETFGRSP